MGRRHCLVSTISPHKCEDVATLKMTLLYIAIWKNSNNVGHVDISRVCWYWIGSGITCIVIGNWRRREGVGSVGTLTALYLSKKLSPSYLLYIH